MFLVNYVFLIYFIFKLYSKASVGAISLDVFQSTHCIVYSFCFLSCFARVPVKFINNK